ncbi:MAG: glycosyltransferase [Actinomyces sp.]|nr:MAG: glycosyltransferase [Actinomyces sp.]
MSPVLTAAPPDELVDRVVDETPAHPDLDIVVPVHDEEFCLETSVRRLVATLADFPFTARVTIADNASTDATWEIAARLARSIVGVRAVHLPAKGRGRALRAVWASSDAEVVAYTDVDLSTGLDALLPLIAPLMSGHSDVAIGTRLAPGARVVRGPRREFISRTYNHLIRLLLRARFSDAQCGFKAVRADVARVLLPHVENDNWFFDTELLLLAERNGLRIHEVSVDWVDDPDSRVDIVATALEDLRGLARVARRILDGSFTVRDIPRRSPASLGGEERLVAQAVRFGAVGALTTVLHVGGFVWLARSVDPQVANLAALSGATVVNTALNRRFTFGIAGGGRLLRDHLEAGLVFAGTLLATGATLGLADRLGPSASSPTLAVVLLVTVAAATLVRFVVLRRWVFAPERRRGVTEVVR